MTRWTEPAAWLWLLPVAALLGGCAAPGTDPSGTLAAPPAAPVPAPAPTPFVALQGCSMLLTSSAFPRAEVEAAVPDEFVVLGSAPGHADVQLTGWSCRAAAVDNATVVRDGVVAFLGVAVKARNESWNRPGHFAEFLLEAWVGEEALGTGLRPFGLPTRVADPAQVDEAGARLTAADAAHAVSGVGGSLGDSPFSTGIGVRYFGLDGAGVPYAWDVTADIDGAELVPRAAHWTFEGGTTQRLAGEAGTRAAHVQSFVASYAFEAVRFEEAA